MNIVLAGASGFLGTRLTRYLKEKKLNVFNYKNKIPKEIDAVINVAGPNSSYCSKYPKKSNQIRLDINRRLLNIIKNKKTKFFYVSTAHVYRRAKNSNENYNNNNNKDAYVASHLAAEKFVKFFFYKKCDAKILRLANCYGYCKKKTSNSWNLIINNIIKNIFIKNKIYIKSKENFLRDFIPVSYFEYIIYELIKKKNKKKIINISSQKKQSILQMCYLIKNLYKKKYKKEIRIKHRFIEKNKKNIQTNKSIIYKKLNNRIKKLTTDEINDLFLFCSKNFKRKHAKIK